jgi:serine kinase of HPr protein (carbohydrate metabolism regulator)
LVRPAEKLAGLIELRGVGILRCDHEPCAVVGFVVDLAAATAERLPDGDQAIVLAGVKLPRLAVAPGVAALPMVLAMVNSGGGANVSNVT